MPSMFISSISTSYLHYTIFSIQFNCKFRTRTVKIVKIPADEKISFEEIDLPIPDDPKQIGDQLLSLLSVYFKGIVRYSLVLESS